MTNRCIANYHAFWTAHYSFICFHRHLSSFLALQFVQVSLCNRAESQSWQDLNAPPCVSTGSAVAPPASWNQWGQWATVALCGADGRRMALPPTVARSATYKWVNSHHWSHNIKPGLWYSGVVHQGEWDLFKHIFLRSWVGSLIGW